MIICLLILMQRYVYNYANATDYKIKKRIDKSSMRFLTIQV